MFKHDKVAKSLSQLSLLITDSDGIYMYCDNGPWQTPPPIDHRTNVDKIEEIVRGSCKQSI